MVCQFSILRRNYCISFLFSSMAQFTIENQQRLPNLSINETTPLSIKKSFNKKVNTAPCGVLTFNTYLYCIFIYPHFFYTTLCAEIVYKDYCDVLRYHFRVINKVYISNTYLQKIMARKFFCLDCKRQTIMFSTNNRHCSKCRSSNLVREDHPFAPTFNHQKVIEDIKQNKKILL